MLERAARIGIVAHGAIYLAFALVAAQVATGDHRGEQGALQAVGDTAFGGALLAVLAVGLVVYGLWRVSLAWRGVPEPGEEATVPRRLANAGRGFVAIGLALACLQALRGGSGNEESQATGTVLGWPGGPVLVGAAGLAIAGVGGWMIIKALRGESRRRVGGRKAPGWLATAAAVGDVGRGLVFGVVGWFLVDAALQHDPSEARSLDAALLELADAAYGSSLLALAAACLACFAVAQLAEAWFRPAART